MLETIVIDGMCLSGTAWSGTWQLDGSITDVEGVGPSEVHSKTLTKRAHSGGGSVVYDVVINRELQTHLIYAYSNNRIAGVRI